jgi:hypothetical protein
MSDQFTLTWRKSGYSSAGGNCVEVASLPGGRMAVRDSKDPDGGVLRFSSGAMATWLTSIKAEAIGLDAK